MEHIWAPWRLDYVVSEKPDKCVLCEKLAASDDIANYVLYRGTHNCVLLNTFPYNSGHLMVVPRRHIDDLTRLDARESAEAGIADHIHLHIVPRWSGDTNYMTTIANTRVVPQSLADSAEQLRVSIQRIAEKSQ